MVGTDRGFSEQLQDEIETLDAFSDAAKAYFRALSEEIRADFATQLSQAIGQDLAAFHTQVNRSLNVEQAVDNLFPQDSVFGDAFGSAAQGALQTVLRDLARNGSVDLERVVRGANQRGNRTLDRMIRDSVQGGLRSNDIPASSGQRLADLWRAFSHAQRNI